MVVENPLFQPRLVLIEGQIPVLRGTNDGLRPRNGGVGIDQFHRTEVVTAALTLVAVCVFVVTIGAFAHDIAVGQELMGLLIVVLFGLFLHQFPLVIELFKEVAGKLMMRGAGRSAINIEADAKRLERLFDELVVAVAHVLRRDTLFLRTDSDGHTMLIAAANEHHLLFFEAQIAHVNIGRHIDSCQMANVNASVGIGQSRRNGGAFKLRFLHLSC